MKAIRLILLTLGVVSLQISFFGAWRPFGVMPSLFLVFILAASTSTLHASEVLAMAVGGGLLLDLSSGADFGLKTAYFCFLALSLVMMRRTGAELERIGMRLAAVLSATLLYAVAIILPLWGHASLSWRDVGIKMLAEVASNLVLMLLLTWPLVRVLTIGENPVSMGQERQ